MSSAGFARSLSIEPGTSRLFAAAVLFLHAGAFALILALPVSIWVIAVLALAVTASCLFTLADPVLRLRPSSIAALEWRGDGRWQARRRDGGEEALALLPDTYIHPWLVVLNFRRGGDGWSVRWRHFTAAPSVETGMNLVSIRRSMILLPDSVDPETLRRLRARLRLEGTTAAGSGTW